VCALLRGGILACLQQSFLPKLRPTSFSISVDGGTAKGCIEYLAISARLHASENDLWTETNLLTRTKLYGELTGNAIYKNIKKFFLEEEEGKDREAHVI